MVKIFPKRDNFIQRWTISKDVGPFYSKVTSLHISLEFGLWANRFGKGHLLIVFEELVCMFGHLAQVSQMAGEIQVNKLSYF